MKKRTLVVTGASNGIGKAIVDVALEENFKVFGISRSGNTNSSEDYVDIRFDLENIGDQSEQLIRAFSNETSIDVLINNAGYLIKNSWNSFSLKDNSQMMEVNCIAPIHLSKLLLPLLLESENAHIVNVSSMAGVQGAEKYDDLFGYGLSKAALLSATEYMATSLKKDGICVNAIAPGAINTTMLEEAFPETKAQVSPQEMARFIVDFACSGKKVMTGGIIKSHLSNP